MLSGNRLVGFGAKRRAAAGGNPGYRFYRWTFTATQGGGNPHVSEVELLLSSTDQIPTMTGATTSGVTASASSAHPIDVPWKTGDNDGGTAWDANAAASQSLKYDFGSAQEIDEYSITANSFHISSIVPSAWTFEGSNNDADWTTLDTQSNQSWSSGETKNYAL